MEKIAILELTTQGTKISFYENDNGKYRHLKKITDLFPVGEEIFNDELIKATTLKSIVNVMILYRELIHKFEIDRFICLATGVLQKARNHKGLIEEIYNNTGFYFSLMSKEEYIRSMFMSLVNMVDVAKGNCVFIDDDFVTIFKFNRRTTSTNIQLPFGTQTLMMQNYSYDEIVELVKNEIMNNKASVMEQGENFVGVGNAFVNLGRITKKLVRYPLDIDNNYQISGENVLKSLEFVKGLDLEKASKIKGLTENCIEKTMCGQAIIQGVMECFNPETVTISTANITDGIFLNATITDLATRVIDLFAASFDNYNHFISKEFSNTAQMASISAILFKQLKVLHKLSRNYTKAIRIAAYMYDCGKNTNHEDYERYSYQAVLNSNISGVTHRDLLLAAFMCMCQNPDNFQLSEFMKYKDILDEEDLNAVRKLGMIIKLASLLTSSQRNLITDISCEVLGDSIIMKIIASSSAVYEVKQAASVSSEFRKIFKKNLQIL